MTATIQDVYLDLAKQIDNFSHSVRTIGHEHHEIHEGCHYFVKDWIDVTVTGQPVTAYFTFTTPNTTTRIHAKALFTGEAGFTITIYEDPVFTDPGTPIVTKNCDRDSDNVAELLAFAAPTVDTLGTKMWAAQIGANKAPAGVSNGFNYEIMAKSNTIYLFEIVKSASGTHYLDYDFFWYEEAPRTNRYWVHEGNYMSRPIINSNETNGESV